MIVLLADRRRREVQSSSYIQSKTANHTQNQQTISDFILDPDAESLLAHRDMLYFERKTFCTYVFAGRLGLSFRSRTVSKKYTVHFRAVGISYKHMYGTRKNIRSMYNCTYFLRTYKSALFGKNCNFLVGSGNSRTVQA
jgi:hypothetical protein